MRWLFIALLLLIACSQLKDEVTMEKLTITSVFQNNGKIPAKYTCSGQDINPELNIQGIPNNAKTLVLIMDDPDAPMGAWVHWIVFNIPITNKIKENSIPGKQGSNSFGKNNYGGPCPPSGTHRYFFQLYALDAELSLSNPNKADVEKAMKNHVLAQGELIGLYSRD